ncbi:hypothetical protein LOD99_15039 [Oopsacas minuta]|uniref:Uncharacterized protein n=1 Tax=Oopsacas minuta TaxID=111878 RepID=A0AAV7KDQ5_9METZ|nr:hypothetical protein LOD99_15039 [Oopsacas minuta]
MSQESATYSSQSNNIDVTTVPVIQYLKNNTSQQEHINTVSTETADINYQPMDIDSTMECLTGLRLSESYLSTITECDKKDNPVSPQSEQHSPKLHSNFITEDHLQQIQQQQIFSSYPTCRDQSSYNPNTHEINIENSSTTEHLDDTTVEDIAGYLEQLEILSRNMSSMAKMMYS